MPGSIQVPPSGTPVILMRDCQTTGGYPKIGTVISADLDRLAQMRPGEAVRLEAVSRDTALAALAGARAAINGLRPDPAVAARCRVSSEVAVASDKVFVSEDPVGVLLQLSPQLR